jgi:hypothetical protein
MATKGCGGHLLWHFNTKGKNLKTLACPNCGISYDGMETVNDRFGVFGAFAQAQPAYGIAEAGTKVGLGLPSTASIGIKFHPCLI